MSAAATAFGLSATTVQSEGGSFTPPQYSNFLSFGIGVVPDYIGSDDNFIGAAPFGIFGLGENRFVSIVANSAYVNVSKDKNFRFGPTATYRFGRDDDVDDSVVSLMEEIDDTVELGAFAGYMMELSDDIRDRATFGGQIAFDVGGVHNGYAASINARRWFPVGKFGVLGLGAAVTYGSGDYMDTYFSVSPVDAATTGLPQYKAGDGLRDARVMALFIHPITKNWVAGGGVYYSRILGDAADSPIVEDRGKKDQLIYGLGIGYVW
ncbi:MipA/OmpV family protein [Tateyamaria sp.]